MTRYPWAVRDELPPERRSRSADWLAAVERLDRYGAALRKASRGRALGPGKNPLLALRAILAEPSAELATDVPESALEWGLPNGLFQLLNLPARRRELADRFAWAVPTEEALAVLAGLGPILEVGAGTGYWAALLRVRGADVVAVDIAPPGTGPAGSNPFHRSATRTWTLVQAADAAAAARTNADRTLFLCWPPPDDESASYGALRAYRGGTVAYVGGDPGGPTGTLHFHRELAANWTLATALALPGWPRLRERLQVFRRNPVRRRLEWRDRCPQCGRFVELGWAGRCDACFRRDPPAIALRVGERRIEYPAEAVETMPGALRRALETSPNRIR